MKILHLTEIGRIANGVGAVLSHLIVEQKKLGHDVRIGSFNENQAYPNLDIIQFNTPNDLLIYLDQWLPDAVLFHSIWSMPFIGFSKILRRKGVPYGVMMHGADSIENRKKNRLKKIIANTLWFDNFMKKAETLVFLSDKEFENCVSKHKNQHHDIIPNGADMVDIDISSQHVGKPIRIVYVGRYDICHKGLDLLIDAICILKREQYNKCIFEFYGNESDLDTLEIKERLKDLYPMATFNGGIYGEKKDALLRKSDIFILTSRFEGMPMGILEAIAYGIPCIVTPGTNMADIISVNKAGWVTKPEPEEIAKTIKMSIDDFSNNYYAIRESTYKLSKNFDWSVIAKQSIEIMKKIQNRNHSNS